MAINANHRAVRLSAHCEYESEKNGEANAVPEATESSLAEVFRRLERIEANVFPPDANTERRHRRQPAEDSTAAPDFPTTNGHHKWSVDLGHLSKEYMGFLVYGNLFGVMSEGKTTIDIVKKKYFDSIHTWLPMISSTRFDKEHQLFKGFEPGGGFTLSVLAMHLLVTPPGKHPPAKAMAESRWYRACKYYFMMAIAVEELEIGMVQAGILIALFEHMQQIDDRALFTLGVSARLAYTLELEDLVARQMCERQGSLNPEAEEAVRTWRCLTLLERCAIERYTLGIGHSYNSGTSTWRPPRCPKPHLFSQCSCRESFLGSVSRI